MRVRLEAAKLSGRVLLLGQKWIAPLVMFAVAAAMLLSAEQPARSQSTLYTITDLGQVHALAINASGQVTGWGAIGSYVWTPTTANGTVGTMRVLVPPKGYAGAVANVINNSGQVAGDAWNNGQTKTHACLWSANGTPTDLGVIGGYQSGGYGINDYGQVVGWSTLGRPTSVMVAMLWTPSTPNGTKGKMISLGFLPDGSGRAEDINAFGEVVGRSRYNSEGQEHAFLWTPNSVNGTTGTMTDLTPFLVGNSLARAINDLGEVIWGNFLYSGGVHYDMGPINPFDINNLGQVVGEGSRLEALLYSGGVIYDLNDLIPASSGWRLEMAYGINDAGQIVGRGFLNGVEHGFLLTP